MRSMSLHYNAAFERLGAIATIFVTTAREHFYGAAFGIVMRMRVAHRSRHTRMSKQFLHGDDVHAAAHEARCEGVPRNLIFVLRQAA